MVDWHLLHCVKNLSQSLGDRQLKLIEASKLARFFGPKNLGMKPLYEGSTQYQNWRFSPEQLSVLRETLNKAAVDAIRSKFEADQPGSSANVSFLTAEEEQTLVKLYIVKVSQLCGHFRFPEEVEATAISYLKRFYLKNTVMDWHPKNVMLTALFLATKTSNNPISLETYAKNIPKTTPEDVLGLEFLIAQSLAFEFAVWHAHKAFWGIWLDLESLEDCVKQKSKEIYDTALTHIRTSRLTDAELIYSPSQIALACLAIASPQLATRWAATKSSNFEPTLEKIIENVKMVISQGGQPPDVETVREIDRRLKLCKNPEKVVGSNAYNLKRAEEERKAEGKRNKKAEEVRRAMAANDPFGEEIVRSAMDEDED